MALEIYWTKRASNFFNVLLERAFLHKQLFYSFHRDEHFTTVG